MDSTIAAQTVHSEPEVIYGADEMPDEVLDIVFEELSRTLGEKYLKKCTLVCRQWARVAYPRRFHNISHRITRYVGEEDYEEVSVHQFMLGLKSMPNVAQLVKELTLDGGACPGFAGFDDFEGLLSCMPSLKSVYLYEFELTFPRGTPNAAFSRQHLERLQLQTSTLDAASLHCLLSLFIDVHFLDVYDCQVRPSVEGDVHSAPLPVDALVLMSSTWPMYCGTADCVPVLSRVIDVSRLHSLSVFSSSDLNNQGYNLAVSLLGRGLDTLTLALSRSQTVQGHVDLSPLPGLKTLHLVLNLPYTDIQEATSIGEFTEHVWPSALRTVETASPTLRRLTIQFQVEERQARGFTKCSRSSMLPMFKSDSHSSIGTRSNVPLLTEVHSRRSISA